MGQNASLAKSNRRKSLRSFHLSSNHTNKKRQLSHTFNLIDNNEKIELLNINQATEEELMTLHGVNREIARNIIEYRKAIGRFRKVEDLALVRGIGADKLELIRPEICVNTKRSNQSCTSSRAQSYDSLKSLDSRLTIKSNKQLVNVNNCNVFELQCVNGITQEIAANIVHYREKKGPFKKIEDLIKVRGVDHIRLDNISRYLTIENNSEESDTTTEFENLRSNTLTNGYSIAERNYNGNSIKLPTRNGLSTTASLFDLFDLLSSYSPRPIYEEIYDYTCNDEPAIRIACWNFHKFTLDKANNLGVKEVICRTILENRWSIIAVQDILNAETLKIICDELNKPKLRRVKEWKLKYYKWNFCMVHKEHSTLGFIYNTRHNNIFIDIEFLSVNQGPIDISDYCEIIISNFKISNLNLQVVNLKLNKMADFEVFNEKVKELLGEDMVLLFVDFSDITFTDNWLNIEGLKAILPNNLNTVKIEQLSNTPIIYHNIKMQTQLTGVNGIVRDGLTHLAIPNGWNWGGSVSPYCPVWIELYVSTNSGTAL